MDVHEEDIFAQTSQTFMGQYNFQESLINMANNKKHDPFLLNTKKEGQGISNQAKQHKINGIETGR